MDRVEYLSHSDAGGCQNSMGKGEIERLEGKKKQEG